MKTNGNGTLYEHEQLEAQLRELMGQGEKARGERDKLVGKLAEKDAELIEIAAAQVAVTAQLSSLYKRQAGGRK